MPESAIAYDGLVDVIAPTTDLACAIERYVAWQSCNTVAGACPQLRSWGRHLDLCIKCLRSHIEGLLE
jgi:hypothetical protein